MKSTRNVLVWIVALLTLGGGLMNIFFLTSSTLASRRAFLKEIFPLEFLHLSKFLVLVIGLALVISSINIYKRKKRAFSSTLLLTCLSIVFHLTKGLDYEQALYSSGLLIILILARKNFTVKSNIPDLRREIFRLGVLIVIIFAYGVSGFWFLDQREFGVNFTIGNSIYETLRFLVLLGDSQIVPHTHHARWFLNSLYLMSVTGIVYSIFALFRPAIYRFRTLPRERALAAHITANYGRSSLDYFKFWHFPYYTNMGNRFFCPESEWNYTV